MTARTCAMCEDRMAQIYDKYTLPPFCVQLLDGGEEIDESEIVSNISVNLCEDCSEKAGRMVEEEHTTPLPECNVEVASWEDAGKWAAYAGKSTTADEIKDGAQTKRKLVDALVTVKAHREGDADRFTRKINEAYVIVWAAQELDVLHWLEGDQ